MSLEVQDEQRSCRPLDLIWFSNDGQLAFLLLTAKFH
jgi:hypothetical protein